MDVIVVDDEPILRFMFSEVLQDAGYTVSDAPTADEALAMLEGGCEARVVVTDVHMPGELDGFELANVIADRCRTSASSSPRAGFAPVLTTCPTSRGFCPSQSAPRL